MADTRLTADPMQQPNGLAGLWPFPGVLLLIVFGAWLFYMGNIAGMEDVATAFYGLGGVTALLLILALRAMAIGRVRRRSAAPRTTRRRRRRAQRAGAAMIGATDDPLATPRRSSIVDEGTAPAEGAIYPGGAFGSGMSIDAPMRARQEEISATPLGEADEARRQAHWTEPTDATFEPAQDEANDDDGPVGRPPLKAEPIAAEPADGGSPGAGWATLGQLEARLNRERAERGAQIAKLEALVKAQPEPPRTAVHGGADRPAERAAATSTTADLAAKVEAVAARLDALEAQSASSDTPKDGNGFMKVVQFNGAVNNQLMPRIGQMIEARVATALDPATLRQSLGLESGASWATDAEGGVEGVEGSLGDRIAAAHAAVVAANEVSQAERLAIREEVEKLQRSVQRAFSTAMGARRTLGDFAEGAGTVAEQLAALRASVGDEGGTTPAAGAVEGRFAEIVREVDEVRGNLGAVTQHVARMGEHYQDLLAHLDRIGERLTPAGRPALAGDAGVQGEVDALRDALTTIIEQNREIRAQQERLSARLEGSGSGES